MARTVGSNGAKTAAAIRRAGIKRIYKHGYEAMRLRDLADDVGIQAGSLYNYIRQKDEFLFDIMFDIMSELHSGLEAELSGAAGPVDALTRFIHFHVVWHTARKEEVFIGNMELRSLAPARRKKVVDLRDQYEAKLRRILEDGNAAGAWAVADPQLTVFATIAALTGVCTWYSPRGRMTQADIVDFYTDYVFSAIGASR